jgi:hypothetical protein
MRLLSGCDRLWRGGWEKLAQLLARDLYPCMQCAAAGAQRPGTRCQGHAAELHPGWRQRKNTNSASAMSGHHGYLCRAHLEVDVPIKDQRLRTVFEKYAAGSQEHAPSTRVNTNYLAVICHVIDAMPPVSAEIKLDAFNILKVRSLIISVLPWDMPHQIYRDIIFLSATPRKLVAMNKCQEFALLINALWELSPVRTLGRGGWFPLVARPAKSR